MSRAFFINGMWSCSFRSTGTSLIQDVSPLIPQTIIHWRNSPPSSYYISCVTYLLLQGCSTVFVRGPDWQASNFSRAGLANLTSFAGRTILPYINTNYKIFAMYLFSIEYSVFASIFLVFLNFKNCSENPFSGRIGGLRGPEVEHPCSTKL